MDEARTHGQEAHAALLQLMRRFMRHSVEDMTSALRDHGLSMPQVVTLQMLREEGPQTVSSIAGHLNLSLGATSHLIDRLVQKELIDRREDPADRRQKLVSLASPGRDVLGDLDRRSVASMETLLARVPEPLGRALYDAVEDVMRALEAPETRVP